LLGEQPGAIPSENRAGIEVDVNGCFSLGNARRHQPRASCRQLFVEHQLTVVASFSFSAL
jgi:hypothetical protein